MTEHTGNLPTPPDVEDPRLDLITDYLAGELPAEAVANVKRRLEQDAEFREYCAPIILAWSVPSKHVRAPMTRAELSNHWDDFTRRVGFAHQRRRARRRSFTMLGVVLLALGASYLAFGDGARAWYKDAREYHELPRADGWVRFGNGREVQFGPDARIRVANQENDGGLLGVRLRGEARFRVRVLDTTRGAPEIHMIIVETAAGYAITPTGEFTVRGIGDTMDVELHRPSLRQFTGFMPLPTAAFVTGTNADPNALKLNEGQRARVVKGGEPRRIP